MSFVSTPTHTPHSHQNTVYLITVIRKSLSMHTKKKKRHNRYIPKIRTASRKAIETRSQYLPVFQLHFAHVVHLYDLQMKINLNNTHWRQIHFPHHTAQHRLLPVPFIWCISKTNKYQYGRVEATEEELKSERNSSEQPVWETTTILHYF